VPPAYGAEFRQDVIDVALKSEVPLCADCEGPRAFGDEIEALDRHCPARGFPARPAAAESAQVRELKRRNRLLRPENDILRRRCLFGKGHQPRMTYPLVTDVAAEGTRGGDLQGVGTLQARQSPEEREPR
jgi:transposase